MVTDDRTHRAFDLSLIRVSGKRAGAAVRHYVKSQLYRSRGSRLHNRTYQCRSGLLHRDVLVSRRTGRPSATRRDVLLGRLQAARVEHLAVLVDDDALVVRQRSDESQPLVDAHYEHGR